MAVPLSSQGEIERKPDQATPPFDDMQKWIFVEFCENGGYYFRQESCHYQIEKMNNRPSWRLEKQRIFVRLQVTGKTFEESFLTWLQSDLEFLKVILAIVF